jgi:tetratricopeptide (TPR) repeat protein
MKTVLKYMVIFLVILCICLSCQKKQKNDDDKEFVFNPNANYNYDGNTDENGFKFAYSYREGSAEINGYEGSFTALVTPSRFRRLPVEGIGEKAFNNLGLTSVTITISRYIRYIRSWAFAFNQLTSVVIPGTVTEIDQGAFSGNRLTAITIGANVKLGQGAFDNGFDDFYHDNGKKAGTYVVDGYQWIFQNLKQPINAPVMSDKEWELFTVLAYNYTQPYYDSAAGQIKYYLTAAKNYQEQKEYEKAIENFIIACQKTPFGIVYYHFGLCLMEAGNYSAAKVAFEKSIQFEHSVTYLGDLLTFDSSGITRETYFAYYNIACIEALQGNLRIAYDNLLEALYHGYPYFDHMKNDADLEDLFSYNNGSYLHSIQNVFNAGSNNTVVGKAYRKMPAINLITYYFVSQNRMNIFYGSVWPDTPWQESAEYEIKNYIIFIKRIQDPFYDDKKFRLGENAFYLKYFSLKYFGDADWHEEYKEIPSWMNIE